jgi:hypothetical protein
MSLEPRPYTAEQGFTNVMWTHTDDDGNRRILLADCGIVRNHG